MKRIAPALLIILLSACAKEDRRALNYAYQDRIVDTLSVIAVENHFFPDEQNNFLFSSGPQTVEALISGSADVAAMGDSAAIILLSKFSDYRIIASHGTGAGRHRIIVRDKLSVESWDDLEGLRIGIKKGTSTYGGFLIKSSARGLSLEDSLVDLKPSLQLSALASGEIDAMVASEPTPSLAEHRGAGFPFDSLETEGMTYPIVLVAHKNTVREKEEQIRKLLTGLSQSQSHLKGSRDEVVALHSRLSDMEGSLVEKSMSLHSYELRSPLEVKESMDRLARILYEMGTIDAVPRWEAAMDASLF